MMDSVKINETLQNYFETHDPKYLSEDTVFIDMGSQQITVGRDAVGHMLHHIYHVAFDARAEITNSIITENKAVLEANFIGTHIGEFAGLMPTNKKVNVPLCVVYDLEDQLIKIARIYLLSDVMMRQLTS